MSLCPRTTILVLSPQRDGPVSGFPVTGVYARKIPNPVYVENVKLLCFQGLGDREQGLGFYPNLQSFLYYGFYLLSGQLLQGIVIETV